MAGRILHFAYLLMLLGSLHTRFFLLLLLLLLAGSLSHARGQAMPPSWTGAAVLPSAFQSTAQALATDAAGNAYLGGIFQQTLVPGPGTSFTAQGMSDGYVAKYSPAGTLLWARQLPGASYTVVHSVVVDAAGDVYVGGYFNDQVALGTFSLMPAGGGTYLFLAKLDAQGQPQWLRQLGGGRGLFSTGMGLDAAGNAYFTGSFTTAITFGNQTLTLSNTVGVYEQALFLVKFNPQGTALWARAGGRELRGGSTPQYGAGLCVSPAGAAYLLWGSTPGAGDFDNLALPPSQGSNDAVIVKYSPQGTVEWLRAGGGPFADLVQRATLDGSGQLLVTGLFAGTATFGTHTVAAPQSAGLLLALDEATGSVNWVRALLTSSLNGAAFYAPATDAAGNSYVGGSFDLDAIVETQALSAAGGRDALVASYTPQGALRWVQQSSGTGDELPLYLACTGPDALTVAGALRGQGRFGTGTITSSNATVHENAFVARLGLLPSASRAAQAAAPLALFPNPAAGAGTVALPPLPAGSRIVLSDNLGRQLRAASAALALPLNGLAPGLYLVQASAPDGRYWRSRLVVQ